MAAFRAYAVVVTDDRPVPRDDDAPPGGRVKFRGSARAAKSARGPFR